jgi:capsular polysaccharide export protein
MTRSDTPRRFLFLQGPHGPFFGQLAALLRKSGAEAWRIGFNRGDHVFWPDKASFIPSHHGAEEWPDRIAETFQTHQITDLVLYGDTRPIHAVAIQAAQQKGITVHVFEEGYLRPYWVTYERGGSNGHSRLMQMNLPQIRSSLANARSDQPEAPATWGDLRQHIFWGAVYHGFVLTGHHHFPAFRPHRALTPAQEFRLYRRRLALLPFHRVERMIATFRIRWGGFPYHLALLQLEHDTSFRDHSPFSRMTDFVQIVIDGFAKGASLHHHLVFKAHPLEDGRLPLATFIRQAAQAAGIASRVHFVRGGKLARLLDAATSAVTINSTAGQQVLWRGLPLKIFGTAVYDKPDLVSDQPLSAFFANPRKPESQAYRDYRRFLLETSQIPGGFYSAKGRRDLLRRVVDRLLATHDPYDAILQDKEAPQQQLRLVRAP